MIELEMAWTAWVSVVFLVLHTVVWIELRFGFHRARAWFGPVREVVERTFWEAFEREWPSLSVVVAARNEEKLLPGLLTALQKQSYDNFELIIVDDGSTDGTAALVEEYAGFDERIRLLRQPASGKKTAIEAGVAAARHPVCVFTDADCAPNPDWLASHARAHRGESRAMVIGYAPLEGPSSALVAFQKFDATLSQFLTAAAIGNGKAYLAKGPNLSYSRALYEEVCGFDDHGHYLSGDDTLFVQAVRRTTNARIKWLDTEAGTVPSPARESMASWLLQKRRHTSTGRIFDRVAMWRAGVFYWTLLLSALFAIVSGWAVLAVIWAVLVGLFAVGLHPVDRAFRKPFVRRMLPVFVPLFIVFIFMIPAIGMLFPPRSWQSRS